MSPGDMRLQQFSSTMSCPLVGLSLALVVVVAIVSLTGLFLWSGVVSYIPNPKPG